MWLEVSIMEYETHFILQDNFQSSELQVYDLCIIFEGS